MNFVQFVMVNSAAWSSGVSTCKEWSVEQFKKVQCCIDKLYERCERNKEVNALSESSSPFSTLFSPLVVLLLVSELSPGPGQSDYNSISLASSHDINVISDPRRGCYIVLPMFIFFFFFFRHFCSGHISGTVTRRDSKLSVLLGPVV